MEGKWRTKKRSLTATAAAQLAKRATTEEPAPVVEAPVSNVASDPVVTAPSATQEANSSPGSDPEIVEILSVDTVLTPHAATVALEAEESLLPSEASVEGDVEDDGWMTTPRGRCLGTVTDDGVAVPCEEETNGSSQFCRFCRRQMRLLVW